MSLNVTDNTWGGHDYTNGRGQRVRTTKGDGLHVIYGFEGQQIAWEATFSQSVPAAVHAAALAAALDELKAEAA